MHGTEAFKALLLNLMLHFVKSAFASLEQGVQENTLAILTVPCWPEALLDGCLSPVIAGLMNIDSHISSCQRMHGQVSEEFHVLADHCAAQLPAR